MRSVEVSAKTREEAIEIALQKLKAERHEVAVEVVNEGSSGFLGFGARNWTIRVTMETAGGAEEYEDDVEVADVRPRSEGRGRGGRNRRGSRRGGGDRNRDGDPDRKEPRGDDAPRETRQPARRENGNRDGGRPERRDEPKAERPEKPAAPAKPVSMEIDERDREAAALLQEMIQRMGIAATVSCRKLEDGTTCLNVESEDSAILIGRKGKTLSAMQYLINRIIRRPEEGGEDRLIVDIEDYLERRQQALEDLALRMAEKAKDSGRRVRVKPLSPQERRIIHVTLQDDTDVRTFSVGDSPIRSVVIAPKNEKPQPDRPRRSGGRGRGGRGRGRGRQGGDDRPSSGENESSREDRSEPREAKAN